MTPQAARDLDLVCLLIARYERALGEVDSPVPSVSSSAYRTLTHLFEQAKALYQVIVSDPVRWQEGLESGAIGGLQPFNNFTPGPGETYGVVIPDRTTLTNRAVEAYRCVS